MNWISQILSPVGETPTGADPRGGVFTAPIKSSGYKSIFCLHELNFPNQHQTG
jgi:hypothetical protein